MKELLANQNSHMSTFSGVFLKDEEKILCQSCDCDEATKFCEDCSKNYCEDCFKPFHKKRQNHKFQTPKRKQIFNCSIHNKEINSLCHDCEVFTCFSCIKKNENHFGHSVEEIENSEKKIKEIVKNIEEESKGIQKNIVKQILQLKEEIKNLEEKKKLLEKTNNGFMENERWISTLEVVNVQSLVEYIQFHQSIKNILGEVKVETKPVEKVEEKMASESAGEIGFGLLGEEE
jgi:uncharacterized protein YdcH (DUF465 family)